MDPDRMPFVRSRRHGWSMVGRDGGDGALEERRGRLSARDAARRSDSVPEGRWREPDGRAAAFADANVFALPSMSENFGNAAAEAAALGVPVLVSDQCGVVARASPRRDDTYRAGWRCGGRSGRGRSSELLRPGGRCPGGDRRPRRTKKTLDWATLAVEQLAIYERALAARV